MTHFDSEGNCVVSWFVEGTTRERIQMRLSDFLVAVKASDTLEELRCQIFQIAEPPKMRRKRLARNKKIAQDEQLQASQT